MPATTRFVIIGAGFAGAATAWALARSGLGPGIVLEREATFGMHASGRNAAIARLVELDPIVRVLARRSHDRIRSFSTGSHLMRSTGALTLASDADVAALETLRQSLCGEGVSAVLLPAAAARARFPTLTGLAFDSALWCPAEGVVDVHALLTLYLDQAKSGGFRLWTSTAVDDLIVEGGRVAGVYAGDRAIRADVVIDASGAWAGRLGRPAPLPLQPFCRHLFVTGPAAGWGHGAPIVWFFEGELYARPEGEGLLMSPCDQTPVDVGSSRTPQYEVDPAAGELLAAKLAAHAPALLEVELRRGWSCLRTFAADRRPVIGPDPDLPGLFHVSALGGFGMTASAALGELAASLIKDGAVDWLDAKAVSARRL